MAFPALTPTSRQFTPGDFPNKKFNTQNGTEVRILYGSKRVNQIFTLSYVNIEDYEAAEFLDDYDDKVGTITRFTLPDAVFEGWGPGRKINTYDRASGTLWRYDAPPRVQQVRPGISSVTVKLRAVAG